MSGRKHWDLYRVSIKATSKDRRYIVGGVHKIDSMYEELVLRGELSKESWKYCLDILTNSLNEEAGSYGPVDEAVRREQYMSYATEYDWWCKGCPTCFVASKDIVDMVYNARYDLDFSGVSFPGGHISFSFPDGVVVNGSPLKPCIFSTSGKSLSITERHGLFDRDFISIPNQHVLDMLLSEDHSGFVSALEKEHGHSLDLSTVKSNLARQRDLMRVCIGLCAYVKAFPSSYRDGYPEGMQARDIRCFNLVGGPMTLDLDKKIQLPSTGTHASPHLHWRQGHFRTYRDDRYKRNHDGSYKIGYVRDAIVGNGSIVPKTVEKVMV